MSDYEKKVIALTKFKMADYGDHQDYLASLVRHTDKWLQKHDVKGDIFDGWESDLADWFDQSIHILNDGDGPLPDFPDRTEPIPEFVPEEVPYEKEPQPELDPTVAEVPEEASPLVTPPPPANNEPADPTVPPAASDLIPAKAKKWGVKKPTRVPTPYDILTGEKDRYGIIVGTKTHDAVEMYERGTSAKEILQATGGRHYNILKKLEKDGHRVVKLAKHRFRLTHKDDIGKVKVKSEDE